MPRILKSLKEVFQDTGRRHVNPLYKPTYEQYVQLYLQLQISIYTKAKCDMLV